MGGRGNLTRWVVKEKNNVLMYRIVRTQSTFSNAQRRVEGRGVRVKHQGEGLEGEGAIHTRGMWRELGIGLFELSSYDRVYRRLYEGMHSDGEGGAVEEIRERL